MIVRTKYGFAVSLPKGKLAVENVATVTECRFTHVVSLTTGKRRLEVYASATGQMRVFDMKNGVSREMKVVEQ